MQSHFANRLDRRIRKLDDRSSIHELVARYGIVLDDRDFDSLATLFTEDAVFEATARGDSLHGKERVIDFYRRILGERGPTFHFSDGNLVELGGADDATGVVVGHAELAIGRETYVIALRYRDGYRRDQGEWRFSRRRIEVLYAMPATDMPGGLSETLRLRWPDREPVTADWPEALETWRSWTNPEAVGT